MKEKLDRSEVFVHMQCSGFALRDIGYGFGHTVVLTRDDAKSLVQKRLLLGQQALCSRRDPPRLI